MLRGPIYTLVQIRLPILLRLEDLLSEGAQDTKHLRIISVEHILPPSPAPDSEWAALFPDAAERSRHAHTLGNLILLPRTKNPEAQQWDFARKQEEYFSRNGDTPFALTRQVLEARTWSPEELERRQRRLVNALVEAWRLH